MLGRNELCWCESGRKYKQCHLDSDTATSRAAQIAGVEQDEDGQSVTLHVGPSWVALGAGTLAKDTARVLAALLKDGAQGRESGSLLADRSIEEIQALAVGDSDTLAELGDRVAAIFMVNGEALAVQLAEGQSLPHDDVLASMQELIKAGFLIELPSGAMALLTPADLGATPASN